MLFISQCSPGSAFFYINTIQQSKKNGNRQTTKMAIDTKRSKSCVKKRGASHSLKTVFEDRKITVKMRSFFADSGRHRPISRRKKDDFGRAFFRRIDLKPSDSA